MRSSDVPAALGNQHGHVSESVRRDFTLSYHAGPNYSTPGRVVTTETFQNCVEPAMVSNSWEITLIHAHLGISIVLENKYAAGGLSCLCFKEMWEKIVSLTDQ